MSMVRRWALVAVAVGLFAYATGMSSAASTSRAPRHGCPPLGAHVIAQDRVLRVYSTGARSSDAYSVRACRRGASASMTLLSASPQRHFGLHHSVGRFVLAGDFVGYIETQFGVDSGTTTLVVVDVASRRTLHEIAAGHYVDAGFVFSEGVTDFVVSNRGSVAWITERGRRGFRGSLEERTVQVVGPTGIATVADASTAIEPTSLRLSGHTLSWSDAGVRRTAPMP
jgi:hypothetical protein